MLAFYVRPVIDRSRGDCGACDIPVVTRGEAVQPRGDCGACDIPVVPRGEAVQPRGDWGACDIPVVTRGEAVQPRGYLQTSPLTRGICSLHHGGLPTTNQRPSIKLCRTLFPMTL